MRSDRKFDYATLVQGKDRWEAFVSGLQDIRTEALKTIVEAFVSNCERTAVAAIAPAHVAIYSRREQHVADCAVFHSTGALEFDLKQFTSPAKMGEPFGEHFKRFMLSWVNDTTEEDFDQFLAKWGIEFIDMKLRYYEGLQKFMESLLGSVVIESWTSFENLALDLWTVALNTGPREVVNRVALSANLKTGNSRGRFDQVEHDHRTEYGSWLVEVGWVSFQRLDDIRLYYGDAFGKDIWKLFDTVEDGYIVALSAFRNALVHKSGRADKQFVERVQRFPELRSIAKGDALQLDGALVKKLRESAYSLGERLIHLVDDVLTPP